MRLLNNATEPALICTVCAIGLSLLTMVRVFLRPCHTVNEVVNVLLFETLYYVPIHDTQ